VRVTREQLS